MPLPALRTLLPTATIRDAAEISARDPGFDARNFGASALVRPADAAGVAALVKFCAERGISLVPQGGRTGLAGGAATVAGQVICDLGGLSRIEEIDPFTRVAIVQAGATLSALQEAAAVHGLDPGIDLAARGSATIGGMVFHQCRRHHGVSQRCYALRSCPSDSFARTTLAMLRAPA